MPTPRASTQAGHRVPCIDAVFPTRHVFAAGYWLDAAGTGTGQTLQPA